jgi:hypothetical protein
MHSDGGGFRADDVLIFEDTAQFSFKSPHAETPADHESKGWQAIPVDFDSHSAETGKFKIPHRIGRISC